MLRKDSEGRGVGGVQPMKRKEHYRLESLPGPGSEPRRGSTSGREERTKRGREERKKGREGELEERERTRSPPASPAAGCRDIRLGVRRSLPSNAAYCQCSDSVPRVHCDVSHSLHGLLLSAAPGPAVTSCTQPRRAAPP
jgi:hypothetical protein